MHLYPRFFDCAESAVLVDFGPQYDSLMIFQVCELFGALKLPGVKETIPALSTLMIVYDPLEIARDRVLFEIERLCETRHPTRARGRTWDIPVVYGGKSGPDLQDVSRRLSLSEDKTVSLHTAQTYTVSMLGFLPGFAYLGVLPKELRIPRRSSPRARVPAGSVAIAAEMTAIYPLESPGGWHLIGYTPFMPWDLKRQSEPLLRPGDQVSFRPIDFAKAEELRRAWEAGSGPLFRGTA